jgi:hypothetical protein
MSASSIYATSRKWWCWGFLLLQWSSHYKPYLFCHSHTMQHFTWIVRLMEPHLHFRPPSILHLYEWLSNKLNNSVTQWHFDHFSFYRIFNLLNKFCESNEIQCNDICVLSSHSRNGPLECPEPTLLPELILVDVVLPKLTVDALIPELSVALRSWSSCILEILMLIIWKPSFTVNKSTCFKPGCPDTLCGTSLFSEIWI